MREEKSGDFTEKELLRLRLMEPLITRRLYDFHPQSDKGMQAKKVLIERFGLTDRERQITGLICRGMTNQQIADKLFCAETTVKKHITSISKKMNVSNRTEIFHCCVIEHAVQNFI
jgi:DNA-binding NarL/FixJ family response regulator